MAKNDRCGFLQRQQGFFFHLGFGLNRLLCKVCDREREREKREREREQIKRGEKKKKNRKKKGEREKRERERERERKRKETKRKKGFHPLRIISLIDTSFFISFFFTDRTTNCTPAVSMSSENAAEKPRKPPSQKPKKPSAPPSSIPKTPSIPPRSRANTEQSTGSFPPLRASASTPEPQNMSKGRKQAPSAPLPVSGLLGDGSGGGEKSLKMSMGGLEDATRKKKKKRNLDGCHDDTEAAGSLNVYLRRGSKNFDYGRSNEPLTLGRAFGPALVGSLREDPNSDSLQLFSMTLEVIKVVVHLSRSFSSYLREVEGEQADREKQKQMIPDAIKQIPEKLELMAKYINLIVNSLGFGVMITLASKDFESAVRESHTQCILDYEKQTPLDANGKGHLAELWGNVTLTSAALLVVLKERKFSLTEKGDEEEGGGVEGAVVESWGEKKKRKNCETEKKEG